MEAVPRARNLFLLAGASGGFDAAEVHWLPDTEVVDGARTAGPGPWQPPNR